MWSFYRVSAAARSTIDSCRTLGIWLVSLGLGWEKFRWGQVIGFGILVYGTFVFNEIARFPFLDFNSEKEPIHVVIDDAGSDDLEEIQDHSVRG